MIKVRHSSSGVVMDFGFYPERVKEATSWLASMTGFVFQKDHSPAEEGEDVE